MAETSTQPTTTGNRGGVARIANCLSQLLAGGDMSDVQFVVGRDYGWLILSARSDVFHAMFNGNLAEPLYIYTEFATTLTPDNVLQTLHCADKYGLPSLVARCLGFVQHKLRMENFLDILEKMVRYKCSTPKIMEKCLLRIDESSEKVWQSEQFCAIGQETLQIILQRDALSADENTIYSAVERWATSAFHRKNIEASSANRRAELGAALYLVRFPVMTEAQLLDGPAKTGLLLQSELRDIFHYKHAADKPQLLFPVNSRQDESPAEGVIKWTIADIRELKTTQIYSACTTVRKLQWKIAVRKVIIAKEVTVFGYFLRCSGHAKWASWTCHADAELHLLPWKTETAPLKAELSQCRFSKEENDWGFSDFIHLEVGYFILVKVLLH
ncbi:BTB/POZ domain-containing protein 6-like [Paramacrobiotus metropolitanus]|uniref:BTB/POZ domain-containing protein 6-like n=1 Tax=Paramacrobiotus metropolitanus TaxID=2943436 RepID=UPI002445EC75|nr:BTB/POZ domain-containing protein 6-like [Paramacrobiotus metropolitanus]